MYRSTDCVKNVYIHIYFFGFTHANKMLYDSNTGFLLLCNKMLIIYAVVNIHLFVVVLII